MVSRLPPQEYDNRVEVIRDRLAETAADAAVWFDATSIDYLTGFHHIQTERPVCLAVTPSSMAITVPRLEVERVEGHERIDDIHHYFDYPDGRPMDVVEEMLETLDASSVIADMDGAPGVMGHEGPALSEYVEVESDAGVDRMRWEKTDSEVALIRESAQWANLGHRYLADLTAVGAHPATVSQRASLEASRAMLDTLGARFVARVRGSGPVSAGFISGEETALPHGHTPNERLEPGDVIITGVTANVDGYFAELERTMFVGQATDEQRHYFDLMLEAQSIAIDHLGPGEPIAEVDDAVQSFFESAGVDHLSHHHVGHNIGMAGHEPPYIDRGWADHVDDETDALMQPGQVYTIEPGLYTVDAGYRHSDTVAITTDGIERLTYFPRDLASNTI